MKFCLIELVYNSSSSLTLLPRISPTSMSSTTNYSNTIKHNLDFFGTNSIKMAGLSVSLRDSGKDQMLERYLDLMAEQSVFRLSRSHDL